MGLERGVGRAGVFPDRDLARGERPPVGDHQFEGVGDEVLLVQRRRGGEDAGDRVEERAALAEVVDADDGEVADRCGWLLDDVGNPVASYDDDAEARRISDALDDLSRVEAVLAEVVDLKYFCGFSFEEIAAMKGLSERTVGRYWTKARAYLHAALRDDSLM